MQRRSEAIRKALTKYNQQAQRLTPPRPTLTWVQVVDYGFLGEFDLLRNSRTDVRNKEWAKPGSRELTTRYMELSRAREEIDRLNVEIKRLRTYMHYEAQDYEDAVSRVSAKDPALAAEIARRWALRRAVNTLHEQRLGQVFAMPGFSGNTDLGKPVLPSPEASQCCRYEAALSAGEDNVVQEMPSSEHTGLGNISDEEQHDIDAFMLFVDALDT